MVSYLPPKSIAEEQRHLREHQEMMEAYKQKLEKEELRKQRRKKAKLMREELIIKNCSIWEKEIIPNWETKYV
jgi:hypothetical protein